MSSLPTDLGSLSQWRFISGFRTDISKAQNHKAENRAANRALRGVLCIWAEKLYVQRRLLAIRAKDSRLHGWETSLLYKVTGVDSLIARVDASYQAAIF